MPKRKEREPCCVADQFCLAAANFEYIPLIKTTCFACGQTVCRNCSSIRTYLHFGKVRPCNECQIEYDGNDKRVMRRLYRLAGYK